MVNPSDAAVGHGEHVEAGGGWHDYPGPGHW
jgi:hypothetical protein